MCGDASVDIVGNSVSGNCYECSFPSIMSTPVHNVRESQGIVWYLMWLGKLILTELGSIIGDWNNEFQDLERFLSLRS